MKTTIHLPDSIARAVFKHQHGTPSKHLGDSFHDSHRAAMAQLAADDFPREITVNRGQRIAGTIVPENMVSKMTDCESRAWSHSPLAGALWETGFRASRAISLSNSAQNNCCNPE